LLAHRLKPARPIVAPDLSGHGRSTSQRFTTAGTIEDIASWHKTLGPMTTLLGYSMGGRMALQYAVSAPQTLQGLVLVSATAGLRDEEERSARRTADRALAERIEAIGSVRFSEEWQKHPLIRSQARTPEPYRTDMQARRRRNDPSGLAKSLRERGTGSMPPVWNQLAALPIPVLLVTGGNDPTYGRLATEMARSIPNATHIEIAQAGHAPHLEEPDAFAHALSAYLHAPQSR
jgi:2-succinyl-6-hydroxy-2,4-cyclohexadiene-1-carboxylate synthase